MKLRTSVAIIGAGVAGMTAAIYLKRAGIDCIVIENVSPGGQILKAFKVENYPGFMQISGTELSNNMFDQIKRLDVQYKKDEVIKIESKKKKKITLKSNDTIECEKIIIATGRKPKKLNVPNLNKFLGKGVSYCATCDGRFFKDQDVVVVGGSNSALEEAIYLSNICKTVTIIHRRDTFRADKYYQDEISKIDNIKVKYNAHLKELVSDGIKLSSLIIEYNNGEIEELEITGCFSSIGYEPNSELFDSIVKLDDEGYIKVDKNYMTNVDGIYASGDIVKKDSYLLITAMNDAVVASASCIAKLSEK